MWPIIQIFRPFASMLFYRSFIKNDVADALQRRHPRLNRDEAMARAEREIRNNRVQALDPLGSFRGPYEDSKTDPAKAVRGVLLHLVLGFVGIGVGFLVFILVLVILFFICLVLVGR